MTPLAIKRLSRDLQNHEYNINENNIVNLQYKNYNLSFYLNEDYPFKPPFVYINNKLISYRYLYFPHKIFQLYIDSGHNCPCCENLSCHGKWSPVFTVLNIIDEYKLVITNMVRFYKKYITSFIPNLPDDILGIIMEYI